MSAFAQIPFAAVARVCLFLEAHEIVRCRRVCKKLAEVACWEELWCALIQRDIIDLTPRTTAATTTVCTTTASIDDVPPKPAAVVSLKHLEKIVDSFIVKVIDDQGVTEGVTAPLSILWFCRGRALYGLALVARRLPAFAWAVLQQSVGCDDDDAENQKQQQGESTSVKPSDVPAAGGDNNNVAPKGGKRITSTDVAKALARDVARTKAFHILLTKNFPPPPPPTRAAAAFSGGGGGEEQMMTSFIADRFLDPHDDFFLRCSTLSPASKTKQRTMLMRRPARRRSNNNNNNGDALNDFLFEQIFGCPPIRDEPDDVPSQPMLLFLDAASLFATILAPRMRDGGGDAGPLIVDIFTAVAVVSTLLVIPVWWMMAEWFLVADPETGRPSWLTEIAWYFAIVWPAKKLLSEPIVSLLAHLPSSFFLVMRHGALNFFQYYWQDMQFSFSFSFSSSTAADGRWYPSVVAVVTPPVLFLYDVAIGKYFGASMMMIGSPSAVVSRKRFVRVGLKRFLVALLHSAVDSILMLFVAPMLDHFLLSVHFCRAMGVATLGGVLTVLFVSHSKMKAALLCLCGWLLSMYTVFSDAQYATLMMSYVAKVAVLWFFPFLLNGGEDYYIVVRNATTIVATNNNISHSNASTMLLDINNTMLSALREALFTPELNQFAIPAFGVACCVIAAFLRIVPSLVSPAIDFDTASHLNAVVDRFVRRRTTSAQEEEGKNDDVASSSSSSASSSSQQKPTNALGRQVALALVGAWIRSAAAANLLLTIRNPFVVVVWLVCCHGALPLMMICRDLLRLYF